MRMTQYSKRQDDKWLSHVQYEMLAILLLDIAEIPGKDMEGVSSIDGLAIWMRLGVMAIATTDNDIINLYVSL